jgi:uncharacterized RDD family membrane protein YckC
MDEAALEKQEGQNSLAKPVDRVSAALVDFGLFFPVLFVWVVLTINYVDGIKGRPEWRPGVGFWAIHLSLLLVALAPTLVSAFWIARRGYSIGKRLLWIKVVRSDGSDLGFLRGVLLRSWLAVVLLARPEVWLAYWTVNLVIMFARRDHRCLHDLLLGTLVVKV